MSSSQLPSLCPYFTPTFSLMDETATTTIDPFNHHLNGIRNHMIDNIDGSVITEDDTIGDSLRKDASKMGEEPRVASIIEANIPNKDKHSSPKLVPHRPPLFSAKELSSSIIASESTRVICSVSIALLVVISYVDYPLLGINIVNSKSIIALRPVYMIIITEITVLIAYLLLERQRRSRSSEEDTMVSKGGGVNWDRAEKMLEGGLVAHQTVRAVFIDFSVYVVTVICFLSLVTRI